MMMITHISSHKTLSLLISAHFLTLPWFLIYCIKHEGKLNISNSQFEIHNPNLTSGMNKSPHQRDI